MVNCWMSLLSECWVPGRLLCHAVIVCFISLRRIWTGWQTTDKQTDIQTHTLGVFFPTSTLVSVMFSFNHHYFPKQDRRTDFNPVDFLLTCALSCWAVVAFSLFYCSIIYFSIFAGLASTFIASCPILSIAFTPRWIFAIAFRDDCIVESRV